MTAHLKSLHIYPVKSCHRVDLESAELEPWGLAGDRRWLVTDAAGRLRTQRELPRMALIRPAYTEGNGLRLTAPGMPDLILPPVSRAAGAAEATVTVWRFTGPAAAAGSEADAWVTDFLGLPSRLVRMDDTGARPTDPDYSRAEDRVSFADGYPLLLASASSLAALSDWIVEMGGEPVPMTRFRPNLVVEGTEPWAEDGWKRVSIGGQRFRVVKRCDRCVMTTVDPELGRFAGQQPLKALRKHRREDKAVYFAVNLIPDTVGALRVGAEFEVID
ncbi:MOSC domain-containing protein [Actinospica sp. MGRD01-02]|uniref:MOSC domain-containing protein n=1 Tax=Actinospica acidithermotolerans TaxID=2828514 RepID=A0A941EA36_9ACTN|nr:MOSC N-terminal beta barrel domain-containing protein [Actinospica acidithermotolerans]MBR7826420.1 MOSC domain-containing protein [Actinospica acidithermotolerans]